jgi:hypothetical protein
MIAQFESLISSSDQLRYLHIIPDELLCTDAGKAKAQGEPRREVPA